MRNIAQKRRYREHEFGGFAAVPRANRDPIYADRFAAPPLSITIPSTCLSKQRARKQGLSTITGIFFKSYCISLDYHDKHFVHRKPWTESARFCEAITSNRGGGIDQCPISQTRDIHRHKRSYEYCCYSCCPTSHWILVHNPFEGVVTNYRRAVD